MNLPQPPITGFLVRRYKRFLADIRLESGDIITVHCPNSGSMATCLADDAPVILSLSDNKKRKYPHTLELIKVDHCWIMVNTHRSNAIVHEALNGGCGPVIELNGYEKIRREVRYGESSRVDLLLEGGGKRRCFVEVKNATLSRERGVVSFPDAVTKRGQKHLVELWNMAKQGFRAVIFFLVAREGGEIFRPEKEVDPLYAELLEKVSSGDTPVEILCYKTALSPDEITITRRIPVLFS